MPHSLRSCDGGGDNFPHSAARCRSTIREANQGNYLSPALTIAVAMVGECAFAFTSLTITG